MTVFYLGLCISKLEQSLDILNCLASPQPIPHPLPYHQSIWTSICNRHSYTVYNPTVSTSHFSPLGCWTSISIPVPSTSLTLTALLHHTRRSSHPSTLGGCLHRAWHRGALTDPGDPGERFGRWVSSGGRACFKRCAMGCAFFLGSSVFVPQKRGEAVKTR